MKFASCANLELPLTFTFKDGMCFDVVTVSAVRQGALYPCLSAMWGQWSPPMERTTLALISYTGMTFDVISYRPTGNECE